MHPIQRQSLPQVVVDGLLVGLAYLLAFMLRFDGLPSVRNTAPGRYTTLLSHTIWWVVPLTLAVLVGFGVYQRFWKHPGRRDFEAIAKGVVVATLLVVAVIALFHPVTASGGSGHLNVELPAAVIAVFLLLSLALLAGTRFVTRAISK
jgi:FlaA1/EpsC-like NDP-sugar epimerase